ncbi:MAG: phosphoribosylformylglycinamidine synthase subunit PurS [Abditibacteriota bacterium]|nr:phosphoribosylformylglycinamidine synthase subunit PurS [Abditibacteriota bacterium]
MSKVKVYVTLKPSLLDAQGKVVKVAAENLGYKNVSSVRIGKFIELEVNGAPDDIRQDVEELCSKLLSNVVIENYKYEIED